jgi:hypothetical protein
MPTLQRANWPTTAQPSEGGGAKLFDCPCCRARYAIVRRATRLGIVPTCDHCDREFPASSAGEWLLYEPIVA